MSWRFTSGEISPTDRLCRDRRHSAFARLACGGLIVAVAGLAACVSVAPSAPPPAHMPMPSPTTPTPTPLPPVMPKSVPSPATTPTAPVPPPNAPVGAMSRGAGMAGALTAASHALIVHSRQQAAAGNLSGAAEDLERALRIEPNQPVLWLELGEVRLRAGDVTQAKIMANKAKSLGARDATVQLRAADLLARASAGAR